MSRKPPEDGPRVFISSTYLDNRGRREAVTDAVIRSGMVPVGMERFTASAQPTLEACKRMVEECDLLLGIVAHRYGWVPDGEQRSITEIEIDTAGEVGIDRFVFVIDDDVKIDRVHDFDAGPDRWKKQERLDTFKEKLANGPLVGRFTDADLGVMVMQALSKWTADHATGTKRARRPVESLPSFDQSLATYLRKAISLHETVSLAGFETRVRVPIRLEDLYVDLDVVADLSGCDDQDFANADHAALYFDGLGRGHQETKVSLVGAFPCAAKLGGRRGLVILGDPGSGKTTHLRRMMLAVLRGGSQALGLPEQLTPVFLPLRDLDDLSASLDAFILAQLGDPHFGVDESFARELVRRDRMLYLLDGLDEVADDAKRAQVAQWIADAQSVYPGSRFVVSCRYAGYRGKARLPAAFLELHLRPLTPARAEEFVSNWFEIVESSLALDKDQAKLRAQSAAAELIDTFRKPDFRTARMATMRSNPLLLTAMCLVHRDRGKLPRRRVELYGECVTVLLELWREAKDLPVTLPARDARRVLQPVALWLHEQEGRRQATVAELTPVIDEALVRLDDARGLDAEGLLRSVRDESGLLTGWSGEQYGFMHLGFQEYLAARELRRRGMGDPEVFRELAGRFGEPWWQEVILLMLALDDPPAFDGFMRRVVQEGGFDDWVGTEMMRYALDEAAEAKVDPFVEVLEAENGGAELSRRQVAALKLLTGWRPEVVGELDSMLRGHGDAGVREVWRSWKRGHAGEGKVITADEGGYELVWIPGGKFLMGSTEEEAKRVRYSDEAYEYWGLAKGTHPERPQQEVEVDGFYLGRKAVTNAEYGKFLAEHPEVSEPEFWADRRANHPDQPVVGISWDEAKGYCTWAGLQLPTEAQWEYACRAGTTTPYWFGDDEAELGRVAWYGGDFEKGEAHPVGQKEPNPHGLYDMYGNVWEWCEDWFGLYEGRRPTTSDGLRAEPEGARSRVIRGGAWYDGAAILRSAVRYGSRPRNRSRYLGFRPARVITK